VFGPFGFFHVSLLLLPFGLCCRGVHLFVVQSHVTIFPYLIRKKKKKIEFMMQQNIFHESCKYVCLVHKIVVQCGEKK
jgi:hypothetical protein